MKPHSASASSACLRALSVAGRLAMAVAVAAVAGLSIAHADDAVKGEVKSSIVGGYGRLIFKFDEPVDAKVRVSGAILVIEFKKPVAVPVERLSNTASDYVSAARTDPDGKAVRIALAGRFRVNVIPAAERLFVDLLPENWTGLMPGLPQDVVDELAARARAAELAARRARASAKAAEMPPIRVKVVKLPTFMRYVFDLPAGANVTPELNDGNFKLHFNQALKWDLADVAATLPETLKSVRPETEFDSIAVVFALNGTPETRSFREDKSYIVDIGRNLQAGLAPQLPDALAAGLAAPGAAQIAPPETVPAKDASAKDVVRDVPAIKDVPALKDAPPLKDAAPREPHAQTQSLPSSNAEAGIVPLAEPKPASAKAMKSAEAVPAATPSASTPPPAAETAPPAKPEAKPGIASATKMSAEKPATPAAPIAASAADQGSAMAALASASDDYLRISLPFAQPTPAAMFRRGDVLWLVFDSGKKIDVSKLATSYGNIVRQATFESGGRDEGIVRLRLTRPQLASLEADDNGWVLKVGDSVAAPPAPLSMSRAINGNKRGIVIPLERAGTLHQLTDPDLGSRLMVVTALAPARGIMQSQDFVELHVLQSMQGVALAPIADDIAVDVTPEQITITRPRGLSLSPDSIVQQQQMAPSFREGSFDPDVWQHDKTVPFEARQSVLIAAAAAAGEGTKRAARYNLARFYIANDMGPEAQGVLSVALGDKTNAGDDVTGSILKALANVMMHRPEDALKDIADPDIANQQTAPIWRAMAHARLGQWALAHTEFKTLDTAIAALPLDLQRMAMLDRMRTDIEVRDFDGASRIANDFETIKVPDDMAPALAVLKGRLAEGFGRKEEALVQYRAAVMSPNRRAAAQARLREIELMSKSGAMPRNEMIHELETLTTVWRGDETETRGLQVLAHLYTEDGRYRDAFHVMRTALLAHPNSALTRKIQDEAAATFDSLFLGGKGDSLPPVEALALFYDYRELTPIGRRGDEMIRKLAERLVAVDLLDQAAELLQHQVDHRLQGAARAQVATRLATIYLMNHKPDFALSVLRKTRSADLSNELRDQRLLLEARALSDVGRNEVALEIVGSIKGREATRLRADIEWSAKHWRAASEQLELMLGDRWKDFRPLSQSERADVLRAAIGYALSDESIALVRLREKYAAKMASTPDARAFDVVSAPIGTGSDEFRSVAGKIASIDTLDAFLGDLNKRFGAGSEALPEPKKPEPKAAPGSGPQSSLGKPATTPVAANKSAAPKAGGKGADPAPTGSIRRQARN
ncbi:MAG: tetratricopeptide repeat protein [Proteobacteria bacterium]|nr:tetratricopeptide repeat protein [Pseudomonadota bacterium]